MKPTTSLILIALLAATVGCSDKKAAEEKAKQDAEAKARADAAKNEMKTLPKTFQTPDYFEKNEPAKASETKKQDPSKTKP